MHSLFHRTEYCFYSLKASVPDGWRRGKDPHPDDGMTTAALRQDGLRLYPFANTLQPGHQLTVELSNAEPLADEHNALLPSDAFQAVR